MDYYGNNQRITDAVGRSHAVTMENRSLFYSPVLKQWRVKKWAGKDARKFIYQGEDFDVAFDIYSVHVPKKHPVKDQNK